MRVVKNPDPVHFAFDRSAMREALDEATKLVAVAVVNEEISASEGMRRIGRLIRAEQAIVSAAMAFARATDEASKVDV